jgi:hypothetical protein
MPFDPDAYLSGKPEAPAAAGSFDPDAYLGKDAPKSGGAFAAKELTPEQNYRAQLLQKLVAAKGEPGYGYRLADSASLGLARPFSGLAALPGVGAPEGITAGEKWRAGVGAEEDYARRAEANTNPYLGAAVDVVGGLASGGPGKSVVSGAATVAKEAPSTLAKIGRAMLGATGSGAIEGAARNSESVGSAATGAGVGGVVGGATGGVLGALTSRLPGVRGAQKEVGAAVREGGSEGLKTEGGALYKKLDQAGIKFKDTDTPALVTATAQKMADKGFNKELHKELIPALEQIGALKGKPATWTQLQNIRTQISDSKASQDPRVRRMAKELGDVLDNFVETTKPVLPMRSAGLVNVAEDSKAARDLWRRGSQAEGAEYLAEKGMTTAKDPGRKLETNFGREIDRVNKPGRYNPNTPEQMALMTEIAKGDPKLSGTARGLNRWGNNLIGYGTAGAAGGAALPAIFNDQYGIGGGASGAGVAAIGAGLLAKGGGKGLRRVAAERGAERVNDLIRNIVTGSTNRDVVNTPRDALAKMLAAEQLKRAGSRYSSSFFNEE